MSDKLFSGDIDTCEIPDGELELGNGMWLGDGLGLPAERHVSIHGYDIHYIMQVQNSDTWQTLRTLFLRNAKDDE